MNKEKKNMLLEEFKQAWEHYRHVENIRLSITGFIIAIFIAGIAGIYSLIYKNPEPAKDAYFFTLVVSFFMGLLTLTVYLRIIRANMVLHHYSKVWDFIRKEFYKNDYDEYCLKIDIYKNSKIKCFIVNEKKIIKCMIITIIITLILYLGSGFIPVWPQYNLEYWQRVIVLILYTILLVFTTCAFIYTKKNNSDKETNNKNFEVSEK